MSDLLDRQAMLEHIEKTRQDAYMMDDIHRGTLLLYGMDILEKAVRNQPSAQSEIINCGNCKHHSDEEPGMVYCPEIIGGWVKNDFFCAIWECKR